MLTERLWLHATLSQHSAVTGNSFLVAAMMPVLCSLMGYEASMHVVLKRHDAFVY